MIKVILCDLGGVLFSDGTKQFVKYLQTELGVDADRARLLLEGEIGSQYRKGLLGRDAFWQTFKKELDLTIPADVLEAEWISGYHLNKDTKRLIRELSKRYPLYYLSDNVQERVDALEAKYHFLSWFRDGIFSHRVGTRKPELKIYQLALEKADVRPEEAVFIDDKPAMLEPARDMGMKTVLFIDAASAPQELARQLS